MSVMHSPLPPSPPGSRVRRGEPSGLVLFVLFFGSLIAAGLIGVWLWNSNPAVAEGRAFGTANQLGARGLVGGPPSGVQPAASPEAGSGADPALVAKGQQLATQYGCTSCHSTTGAQIVGPTWKGLAGRQETLDNGQTVTVDDAYLKESILDPDAKIVKGFQKGVMAPAVKPNEAQIQQGNNLDALIAYIKSLK